MDNLPEKIFNGIVNNKKKYLNFLKLYNKNLSNYIIADDLLELIEKQLKKKRS